MNARPTSFRAAVLALAAIGLAVATNGCSAAPGTEPTGQGSEELVRAPITNPIPLPVFNTITTKTSAPVPDGAVCSGTIAVPAALDGYGCTLGVQIAYPGPVLDTGSAGYAFACQSDVVLPETLDLPPFFEPHFFERVSTTSTPTSCFGVPDDGYTIVLDMFTPMHIGTGGCRGSGCSGY
jgi:hypothetical protein